VTEPRLVVLSGPSGVGKGSVVANVRARHPQVWLSVSWTTRPPRQGESEGVEYHFVDPPAFRAEVRRGGFLEHAEYAGHLYGTPRAAVDAHLAAGTPALLEIDLQGARQVRAAMPGALLVFLAPPSFAELSRRLAGRATEDPARLAHRLQIARAELAAENEFDVVIINAEIEDAADRLVALLRSPV
jgi:guanylate kinase